MNYHILTAEQITAYVQFLRTEERSSATVEKYSRDIFAFAARLGDRPVTKENVAGWKMRLQEDSFSPATVNAKLSAVNGLLRFLTGRNTGLNS